MKAPLLLGLTFALATSEVAAASDETLRYFLSRSMLVVLGEVTSAPVRVSEEVGSVHYRCNFQILDVLSDRPPQAKSLHVSIARFELEDADQIPELRKGHQCILFLNNVGGAETPQWETSDVWFGVQRASPSMAKTLKRLTREERANPIARP